MRKVSWIIVLVLTAMWLSYKFQQAGDSPERTPASSDPYSTAPVKAPVKASFPQDEHAKQLSELRRTQACYDPQNCKFPKTDPKSYELALGQSLAAQLKTFSARFSTTHRAEVAGLAREMVQGDDAFVQDAALKVLASLPISAENLGAIASGIEGSPDPSIVEQGMNEMRRYIGTDSEPQVHILLGKIMSSGAHFSSQTVATGILPFINDSSYPDYERTEQSMDQQTTAAQRLKSALEEYNRQKSGS